MIIGCDESDNVSASTWLSSTFLPGLHSLSNTLLVSESMVKM